jgi:hypothetical protein
MKVPDFLLVLTQLVEICASFKIIRNSRQRNYKWLGARDEGDKGDEEVWGVWGEMIKKLPIRTTLVIPTTLPMPNAPCPIVIIVEFYNTCCIW